jgi:hypothetical protein
MLRLLLPPDDPIRVRFEAASARIWSGDGVYADPFCPECTIVRVSWREGHVGTTYEYPEYCERHRWREAPEEFEREWNAEDDGPTLV